MSIKMSKLSIRENVYFPRETGSLIFEESEGAPTKSNVLILENKHFLL